jgi:hypothetical protein
MKQAFIVAIFNLLHLSSFSQSQQTTDYMDYLKKSDWATKNSWFGDSLVFLTPLTKIPIIDTTNNNNRNDSLLKVICIARKKNGERIQFTSQNELIYYCFLSCPVGEYIYDLKVFQVIGNKINVKYRKCLWNEEETAKYKTADYTIDKYTPYELVLKLARN